jgi:flagellar biosynthesis GTPase FlhF
MENKICEAVDERIKDSIKALAINNGPLSTMISERKNKASEAIIRTVKSCDDIHNIPSVVADGFRLLGLYPFSSQQTIDCCSIAFPEDEKKKIIEEIPGLADLMNTNGQVTEIEMDSKGIPRSKDDDPEDKEKKDKDKRPQQNQRAIILTHSISVARRRAFLEQKQQAIDQAKADREKWEQEKSDREKEREDNKKKKIQEKLDKQKAREEKIEAIKKQKIEKEKEKEEKKIEAKKRKSDALETKEKVKEPKRKRQSSAVSDITMSDDESLSPISSSSSSLSPSVSQNPMGIPPEVEPFLDFIFSMVDKSNWSSPQLGQAKASSLDVIKALLRNQNREHTKYLTMSEVNSLLFWDNEVLEINIANTPRTYRIPGPVLNPFNEMSIETRAYLEMKLRNEPSRISNWLPKNDKKFLSPIPFFSMDSFNHVPRTQYFKPNSAQVIKHGPRVCTGHVDHGFGWLYCVQGLKIIIFINEVDRVPGSSTDFVRGCPTAATWDFDILSQSPNVKYFIALPGTLMVVPGSVKHIVISPQESLAYGSFISHVYGAVSDFAHYLDIHRETNTDFTNNKDLKFGIGIHETNILGNSIIKTIDIDRKEMEWNHQKLCRIIEAKKASFVSIDRALKVKIDKILNLCK